MTLPRQRLQGTAALTATAALLVACSGDDGGTSADEGPDPDNPVAITVGTLPAGDYAPLYIAQEQGFFEEEGLDVTIEIIAGGAVGVTQLVSDELQFSSATWTNVLTAVSQGLELQVVREGTDSSKEGINAIIASEDSGIESTEDLRGTTISVNTLASATELQVRDCLESAGLSTDDYELVEVPFPEVGAAISQGRIDAGFVPDPFITMGEPEGLVPVMYGSVCNEDQADSPLINWVTSTGFAEDNPEVVAAFVAAMDRATELAIDEPETVVEILPTFTTLTPELAEAMTHPSFVRDGTPDIEGAELTADLMLEWGLLDEPIEDVSQYAWQGE